MENLPEFYLVRGWFDSSKGLNKGTFYGAVATPNDYLHPKRVVLNGDEAVKASKMAAEQTSIVYPEELQECADTGGLNPKERAETKKLILDKDKKKKSKKPVQEMTGSGGIASMPNALGLGDRGGHGHIDNLGPKKIKVGNNIVGGRGTSPIGGKLGAKKPKNQGRTMRGFGNRGSMRTISQSPSGRKGGNPI